MSVDYSYLESSRPAKHVKTINVEPVPSVFSMAWQNMKMQLEATTFSALNAVEDKAGELIPTQLLVTRRPPDAQVL